MKWRMRMRSCILCLYVGKRTCISSQKRLETQVYHSGWMKCRYQGRQKLEGIWWCILEHKMNILNYIFLFAGKECGCKGGSAPPERKQLCDPWCTAWSRIQRGNLLITFLTKLAKEKLK